jgi:hypothetical protein
MKRKIYSDALLQNYAKNFKNQLSKFIHANFLAPEDLGKEIEMNGVKLTIEGLNDDKQVVLKQVGTKNIYVTDSKDVKAVLPVTIVEPKTDNEDVA